MEFQVVGQFRELVSFAGKMKLTHYRIPVPIDLEKCAFPLNVQGGRNPPAFMFAYVPGISVGTVLTHPTGRL